ncbi:MAG: HdeA/HdeB family chaperone [Steroidobacteraceae bacterium]|jgi:hypothetical protein
MKILTLCAVVACLLPCLSRAVPIDIGILTCDSYESDIMNAPPAAQREDAVDVVMWLFGYAVAKSGAHVMYGEALQQFGNALDLECKTHAKSTLLDAVATVKLTNINPMDLDALPCATFEARHADMAQSDPQSANTIMMWLLGYSVGKVGGHVLDSSKLAVFAAALADRCTQHPDSNLYDALAAVKLPKPKR